MAGIFGWIKKVVKEIPPLYHLYLKMKRRKQAVNFAQESREIPGVFGRVHKYDFMIAGDTPEGVAGYNRIGASVVSLIEQGLSIVNRKVSDVKSLLDFGCGYGRVTRALVQTINPRKIHVFDVDPNAVFFCAQEFRVKPLYFKEPDIWDYSTVPFSRYDVIWLGSVFTHLSQAYTAEMLKMLVKLLKPGGLLIFTTHGDQTLHRLQTGYYGNRFKEDASEIIEKFNQIGFAFIPYEKEEVEILPFNFVRASDFGMTWMSQQYVDNLVSQISGGGVTLLRHLPLGWDHHQDVYYFQRKSP